MIIIQHASFTDSEPSVVLSSGCCTAHASMMIDTCTAVDLVEEPDFHFHAARHSHRAAAQQPRMDDITLAPANLHAEQGLTRQKATLR